MKIKYIAAILIGIAGLSLQQAKADTFNFTSDHCTGGCGPQSSFGTVTLTQVGNDVNVVVSLLNGNQFVKTGAGGDMSLPIRQQWHQLGKYYEYFGSWCPRDAYSLHGTYTR